MDDGDLESGLNIETRAAYNGYGGYGGYGGHGYGGSYGGYGGYPSYGGEFIHRDIVRHHIIDIPGYSGHVGGYPSYGSHGGYSGVGYGHG